MNDLAQVEPGEVAEVERYELAEDPRYHFTFDRRQFLKAFSAGIALLVPMSHLLAQEDESGRGGFNREVPQDIGAWIHVDQDGSVVVYTGKVEFGQNIRTSLRQTACKRNKNPTKSGVSRPIRLVDCGRYGRDLWSVT